MNRFLMEKVELPLIAVVADLEENGYRLDTTHFEQLSHRLRAELAKLQDRLRGAAGGKFNPASPAQVGELLYKRLGLPIPALTDCGRASTNEKALKALTDQTGTVEAILRHRQLDKLLRTYCNKLLTQTKDGGRLRVTYRQIGAESGRFSSRGIIQTIPKEEEFDLRAGFVTEPGHKIVAADYVQQELALLAALSGDSKMQAAVKAGVDLHGLAAIEVFGLACEPHEVKAKYKCERDRIKAIQFGLVYGRGANSLATELQISVQDAEQLVEQYFTKFVGVKQFIDEIHARVSRDGFIDDVFGRRRYLPDARRQCAHRPGRRDKRSKETFGERQKALRAAQNHVIQAPAATITKLAMIRCHEYLARHRPQVRLILTLHDELQFEVPDDQVVDFAAELPGLMTDLDLKQFNLPVHLRVDVKTGPSWGRLRSLTSP